MGIYSKTFYPLMDIINDMLFNDKENSNFSTTFNNISVDFIHEIKKGLKDNELISVLTLHKANDENAYDLVVTEDTTSGQIRSWLKTVGIL